MSDAAVLTPEAVTSEAVQTSASDNPFVQALYAKIGPSYAQLMGGKPALMTYANGLHSTFQGGPNAYWNPKALGDIDLTVAASSEDGLLTLASQSFSSLYLQVLQATTYVLSQADQNTIRTDQQNAQTSIIAVISAYEQAFGTITSAQQQSAVPPSKIGYIQQQVTKLYGGDITKAPSSLNSFKIAYQTYEVQAAQSFQLLDRSSKANLLLDTIRANLQTPTAENGGLQTGPSTFQAGYQVPAQAQIDAGLRNDNNAITITVDVSSFSSHEAKGSVEGGAGFDVPVFDLFSVDVGGSTSYDWSQALSSGSTMSVEITWKGVTVIGVVPEVFDNAHTGWYSDLVLSEAVGNMGKGDAVTGFQVQGSEFVGTFGEGQAFSRLQSVLVSQVPTMAITFTNADSAALASTFKEQSSVSVDLFGFIPLGHVSQSYEVSDVTQNAEEGSITITFGPSPAAAAEDSFDYTAYLLAGVPAYPPSSASPALADGAEALLGDVQGEPEVDVLTKGKPYQCLQTNDFVTYCSSTPLSSHAVANQWVKALMTSENLTSQDVRRIYQSGVIPGGAVIWP